MPDIEPLSIFSFLHDFLYLEITHLLLNKKRIRSFQDIILSLRILEFDRLSSPEYRLDNCIVNNILTPLTWHDVGVISY